ncbi:MAG TPA: NAD(+) synthase [Verrucomicrobiales bacterium]|nr:NAD(+) synthase [Verrucomicrobiales bacterium]
MRLIKLAAAVLNQTPLDWRGNKERIVRAIDEARRQGASVLCLPELCITGYGCEDAFHSPSVHRMAWRILHEILPLTKDMVVSAGLPVMHQKGIFNFACLMVDGKIAGFTGKRFLAGDGIHYEPRWFKPWPEGARATIDDEDGTAYPCGDLYFDIGGVKFGFEICEDAWVANRPGITLALKGVDIFLNPSASHFAFGKHEIRKRFVLEGSRAFGASYVYANLLGNESGRAIFDGEAMIATQGQLRAVSERFSFQDVQVISALVDVDTTRMNQARTSSYRPNLSDDEDGLVSTDFSWPVLIPALHSAQEAEWEHSASLKSEEFSRAVPLALFDYLRKSRSRGFVVSLSGGADSAAVTVLVRLMVDLALKEIGAAGVKEKLSYISELASAGSAEEFMAHLLTTAYQASANSGKVTRNAARAVAKAAGSRHFEFNISKLISGYTKMIEGGLGRTLTWEQDDIALQNIQARVRSPGIWMLANILGALLLSTSNRSEAAVGYATMDGDTSGGLSPIAGIDKAWLREWLVWMEKHGPLGLHPLPALRAINVQAPTAELRPQESNQTDESDLMPYPLLDAIERAAIRDKQSPLEAWHHLRLHFPQYGGRQLCTWVERFFTLWCRNQWKRERYAPSFHLDDENLDPKTWCRFPILSGGFREELEELRRFVESQGE